MYCAYITTIKEIHKHSNADRLQCCTIFGNNVIIDMSFKVGDRVVYFPVDGQLSLDFAFENNLLRMTDKDGKSMGGYLDPEKRNIKALRLRGEKSDGLILPISCLAKYTNIDSLQDGDQITTLNGVEICKKYIPKSNNRANFAGSKRMQDNNKKKIDISYPMFLLHTDTEQLVYHQDAFKPGDICCITLKMHGCFASGTKVRMADGTLKAIQKIKVGDKVLSFDINTQRFKPTVVTKTFKNDKSEKWQKIKISRAGLRGDKRGFITCTPNHPFWDNNNHIWIKAKDLKVGQNIQSLFPSYILSKRQREILVGNYLGDGCLETLNGFTAQIDTSCKKDKEEYLDYLIHISNGLYYKRSKSYTSGYGTEMVRAKTLRYADIYDLFDNICYLDNHVNDKLKNGLIDEFTDLSMAILYMDDGSLGHMESQKDRANFALCDYSDNDIKIIQKCFRKYGIESIHYRDTKGYNRLRLNHNDAYKMFDLIHKYIPPVMRYKLPKEYRELEYKDLRFEDGYKSYLLKDQTVLVNTEIYKNQFEYDLETEQHNYIVGNAIVHNTSQRTANTIQVTKKVRPYFIKKLFHINDKIKKEYKVISGSRRVTLKSFEGGYYGDNKFRQKWHDFFKDKLPKGYEIYYEVVGYVNDDKPIMAKCKNNLIKDKEFARMYGDETIFSYDCDIGENKAYVYRMTAINEDGHVIEIPWHVVQIEAERMGIECVPTFETFIYTTWDDLMQRVEKYYDGTDPIGRTHIREGVVVRILNRESFVAYKHKNWNFKCLESIVKDIADTPDIEEAQELISEEVQTGNENG